MKKLSDYKNEEAIDLWAELLDPISNIFSDEEVQITFKDAQKNIAEKAKIMCKLHSKDVAVLLLAIDPTPIDGINLVIRLIDILKEVEENEELKSFFSL